MKFIQEQVRWGIIGCGDVCEVKSGPAFSKVANSTLAAVMRRDKEKAKDFARRHNVSMYYDDAEALINDSNVNAIYIATPPAFHEAYTLKALQAGKPVYVEKPVTLNSASCERMIQASHKFQVPVVCAHYRRALPLFEKVRSLIREGAIGKVNLVMIRMLQALSGNIIATTETNWRTMPELSGGGLFHDLAPHQLDIMYWLFGDPVNMHGRAVNQGKHYNAPDVTTLELWFDDEICFQGLWSFNVPVVAGEDSCIIIGDKGSLSFAFFRNPVLEIKTAAGAQQVTLPIPPHIQQPMIDQTVRYLRGEGVPNPCSLEEALVSLKMMDSATAHH